MPAVGSRSDEFFPRKRRFVTARYQASCGEVIAKKRRSVMSFQSVSATFTAMVISFRPPARPVMPAVGSRSDEFFSRNWRFVAATHPASCGEVIAKKRRSVMTFRSVFTTFTEVNIVSRLQCVTISPLARLVMSAVVSSHGKFFPRKRKLMATSCRGEVIATLKRLPITFRLVSHVCRRKVISASHYLARNTWRAASDVGQLDLHPAAPMAAATRT
ncbi:hypothetical protein MRX96_005194 [Rhipicephalus microplus]